MKRISGFTAVAAAFAMVVMGFLAGGGPAFAAAPGGGGGGSGTASVSVPVFAIIAIGVIAGFAIWQGVRDSHKKKAAAEEKDRELEEVEEFEKYFEDGHTAETAAATALTAPTAATADAVPSP